jgi:hypothetical protein
LVDLFDEVDEELRADRAASLIRRATPWVILVLAVVLVGYLAYWGYTAWQDRNLASAGAAYQKGVDALGQGDTAGALASFQAAEKAGAPGYRTLALMQEGDLALAQDRTDAAVKAFDSAASSAPNQIFGDLARLKAADALLDTAPLPQLKTRLQPLTDSKRPYWLFAKEALAMAELMAGKADDAKRDCSVIQLSLGVPEDMRQRCQLLIAVVDHGEGATAVAAAKLAATMPPSPPMTLAPPLPGAQSQGEAPSSPAGAAQ